MRVERKLGGKVLTKASLRCTEYAWSWSDVEEVISAAEEFGLANLGDGVLFILPQGIYDFYWLEVSTEELRADESWSAYVSRSANEMRTAFRNRDQKRFIEEARRIPFLAEKLNQGESIMQYLWFEFYFVEENEHNLPL